MAFLAVNFHYAPSLATFNIRQKFFYAIKRFLHINVRHDSFIKVLYLVVGCLHTKNDSTSVITEQVFMRRKPKSKAADFQSVEGGAVPTSAHHKEAIT